MTQSGLWLKQHGAAEKSLAKTIGDYFSDQIRRVAALVDQYDYPTSADVHQFFRVHDEHDELIKLVRPHFYQIVQVGAMSEIDRVSSKKSTELWRKELTIDGQQEFAFATELPTKIVDAIKTFCGDLLDQEFWQEIQQASGGKIGDVITEGLKDGLNGHQMAKKIQEAMGGDFSKIRARAIARTETTGAMNSGHLIGMQELAKDGLIQGKTWLAISDGRTRTSHAELNEKTVHVEENFNVDGSFAPYPGYAGLPAEERVNCRCTIVSEVDNGEVN